MRSSIINVNPGLAELAAGMGLDLDKIEQEFKASFTDTFSIFLRRQYPELTIAYLAKKRIGVANG